MYRTRFPQGLRPARVLGRPLPGVGPGTPSESVPRSLSPGLGTDPGFLVGVPREELQQTLKPAPDSETAFSTHPSRRPGSTKEWGWDRARGTGCSQCEGGRCFAGCGPLGLGPGALGVAPALVGSSSLWQQQEKDSLQEAAKTAECGHQPVGAEARLCADHTLEDISLGGKRDS